MISVDASEVRAYAAQLTQAPPLVERGVRAVVSRGALNIKNDMNAQLRKSKHFKGIAGSVTYDMRSSSAFGGGAIEAEIGPDHAKGGALANVAYFGTSRGGGTVEDPQEALAREEPNFLDALADLAAEAVQ